MVFITFYVHGNASPTAPHSIYNDEAQLKMFIAIRNVRLKNALFQLLSLFSEMKPVLNLSGIQRFCQEPFTALSTVVFTS